MWLGSHSFILLMANYSKVLRYEEKMKTGVNWISGFHPATNFGGRDGVGAGGVGV